jgi:hypothetical protein
MTSTPRDYRCVNTSRAAVGQAGRLERTSATQSTGAIGWNGRLAATRSACAARYKGNAACTTCATSGAPRSATSTTNARVGLGAGNAAVGSCRASRGRSGIATSPAHSGAAASTRCCSIATSRPATAAISSLDRDSRAAECAIAASRPVAAARACSGRTTGRASTYRISLSRTQISREENHLVLAAAAAATATGNSHAGCLLVTTTTRATRPDDDDAGRDGIGRLRPVAAAAGEHLNVRLAHLASFPGYANVLFAGLGVDARAAKHEAPMLPPACAVEDVDVGHALGRDFLARIPGFDVVVFRVTAARRYLLVALQIFDPLGRDASRAASDLDPIASQYVRHQANVATEAPKSSVNVSPLPSVKFPP